LNIFFQQFIPGFDNYRIHYLNGQLIDETKSIKNNMII